MLKPAHADQWERKKGMKMIAIQEVNLGQRVWSGSGKCRGPQYGEVYEITDGRGGYMVVTKSSANSERFDGHRAYTPVPAMSGMPAVTAEQCREAAENDAWHRCQGH